MKLLIIFVFTLTGIFPSAGLQQHDGTIKVQITHSHEHDHHHHHEHVADSFSRDHAENHQVALLPSSGLPDTSKHSDKHSHELVVSGAHTIFIEPRPTLIVAFDSVASYPDTKNESLPRNRALGSIFRPPITTIIS